MPAKARYLDFCRTAPDVPVFAQPWYLDACAEGGAWDVVLAEDTGRLVAALPYFHKQKGPFRHATMPPFVKWLGPYLLPEFRGVLKKEHELLAALIGQLPDFAAFKQNFHPDITNWLPFYWQQFRQTTYYTYRLNGLHQLAQVEAGLNRNIRRNIQKAQQQVRVVHNLPPEQFYQVNKLSFDRQGLAMPYSWAQFARHDEVGRQWRPAILLRRGCAGADSFGGLPYLGPAGGLLPPLRRRPGPARERRGHSTYLGSH
jgi:hypothetical protein